MESVTDSMKQESSSKDMSRSIVTTHTGPIPKPPAESSVGSVHETTERRASEETTSKCKDKDHDGQRCDNLSVVEPSKQPEQPQDCGSGRERLKRHREEVSGRVMIPDSWGQESLLRDWIDYSTFDAPLVPKGISSAREALMSAQGRRPSIESRC